MKIKVTLIKDAGEWCIPMTNVGSALEIARAFAEDNGAAKQAGCFYAYVSKADDLVATVEYSTNDIEWRMLTLEVRRDIEAEQARIENAKPQCIAFNTNRPYTARGQRIIAIRKDDWIAFSDLDRGIDGLIKIDTSSPFHDEVFKMSQADVMSAYDNDHYKSWDEDPVAKDLLQKVRSLSWETYSVEFERLTWEVQS